MYCPKCGAEISDEAKFCSKCGAKFDDQTDSAIPTEKTRTKRPTVFALVGVALVVGLVVAGVMTNWFGLTGKQGVWVVTKAYQGDKLFYENEYDGNGLTLKSVSYHDGDKSSVSYAANYDYENPNADAYTISYTNYDEDSKEAGTGEERYESELDKDGRLLTERLWWSSDGPLKESDLAEDNAIFSTYKYDSEGNIREIVNEDPDGASYFANYKSIGYDTYGYARTYRANGRSGLSDVTYELSYSDDGTPQAVAVDGKKFTFDTDRDGNITAVYSDEGELLRQFEYKYISHPKRWISRRNSVYVGCKDW